MRDKHYILLFNRRQYRIAHVFVKLKLIEPTDAYHMIHPITHRIEGDQQVFLSYEWVFTLLDWLMEKSINDDGREARNRLVNCGFLRKA